MGQKCSYLYDDYIFRMLLVEQRKNHMSNFFTNVIWKLEKTRKLCHVLRLIFSYIHKTTKVLGINEVQIPGKETESGLFLNHQVKSTSFWSDPELETQRSHRLVTTASHIQLTLTTRISPRTRPLVERDMLGRLTKMQNAFSRADTETVCWKSCLRGNPPDLRRARFKHSGEGKAYPGSKLSGPSSDVSDHEYDKISSKLPTR